MSYTDLDVYKRSYQLALKIHETSLTLPKILQFDLGDQIRRASRSIPSNIAEGYGRNKSKEDVLHFLKMSLGSNDEIIFNLNFMKDTKLISVESFEELYKEYVINGKQLYTLIESIKTRKLATSN